VLRPRAKFQDTRMIRVRNVPVMQ